MKFLYPDTELSMGSKESLKGKSVLQPSTSAISSFSAPFEAEKTVDQTTEPSVVTLN